MWRLLFPYLEPGRLATVALENVLLVLCILDAARIRLGPAFATSNDYPSFVARAFVIGLIIQLNLHFRDVYDLGKTALFPQFFSRLAQALLMASAALSLLFYFFSDFAVGRGVFVIGILLVSVFLTAWHSLLRLYFGVRTPRSRILIIGTGPLAQELVTEVLRRPEMGIGIAGFVDDDPSLVETSIVNQKVLGLARDLKQIVAENNVDRVIVGLEERQGQFPLQMLLNMKTRGITIEHVSSLYERVSGKIAIENLKSSWMIFNPGFEVSKGKLLKKRVLSLAVSVTLLMLFAPLVLLIMALIKLDSRGRIFFGQERVGQDGRVFTLWKFRSMREDAERDTGPIWASANDQRVTRVGRLLRRMRLDELPQLFNVLRGDMSLVGPRPERPYFVNELAETIPFYYLRHAVKPGVTGWAQINYHYGSSLLDAIEKLKYDLFYVKHMSWLLDTIIIFQTIKIVLFSRGS
jgi:sugar transferase (PEP-CTERM system associated)